MAQETYDGLVARGIALAEEHEFAEAIRVLRQAIDLDEDQPDAHYNLGVVYGLLAMSDLSVDDYFEDHVDEEILLQNAIEAYQRVLEIDAIHIPAHNNLGTLYALHGERELATHELELSLELDPDQPEIREQLDELRGI
jgi:tetratricopeptide (TPR) repeat protein